MTASMVVHVTNLTPGSECNPSAGRRRFRKKAGDAARAQQAMVALAEAEGAARRRQTNPQEMSGRGLHSSTL
jgi:hypothetical protein